MSGVVTKKYLKQKRLFVIGCRRNFANSIPLYLFLYLSSFKKPHKNKIERSICYFHILIYNGENIMIGKNFSVSLQISYSHILKDLKIISRDFGFYFILIAI